MDSELPKGLNVKSKTASLIESSRMNVLAMEISAGLSSQERFTSVINVFSVSAGSRGAQYLELAYMGYLWNNQNEDAINNFADFFSPEKIRLAYEVLIENTKSLSIDQKNQIGTMMNNLHTTEGMTNMNRRNAGLQDKGFFQSADYFENPSDYVVGLIGSLKRFQQSYGDKEF